MSVVGIIVEYNPFHEGHMYHINKAKEITNADSVIAIMSGNYVQRGVPAIMPKYLRTKVAIDSGCDLVIELPYIYSTATAPIFSLAAITALNKLNIVDHIVFGTECSDITVLNTISDYILSEPYEYKRILQDKLKEGMTYAAARDFALNSCLDIDENILKQPNNILAIEYLKALRITSSKIVPHAIQRVVSSYNDSTANEYGFYSATSLRKHIISNGANAYDNILYNNYTADYHTSYPIVEDDFSLILGYRLVETYKKHRSFEHIFDISKELSNRIIANIDNYKDFNQFSTLIKTKNYTLTYVNRALLHILLNIKQSEYELYKSLDYINYFRVLGIGKNGTILLNAIKAFSNYPIITKVANASTELSREALTLLEANIEADNIYRLIAMNKYKSDLQNEFTQKLIKFND